MIAVISDCGTYRYFLSREGQLTERPKSMLFIMLNPSTADATVNDPTIRRCIGFAMREGCSELVVVNLFALRATNPVELAGHPDPVGPENDEFLAAEIAKHRTSGSPIVAAWGAHSFARDRARKVIEQHGPFLCLGITRDGSPRHPLYVKADAELKELMP